MADLNLQQIALLIPVVILQYGLAFFGLYDLFQEDRRVRGDNKIVWALVCFCVGIIGPLVYLFFGRDESRGKETGTVATTDPAAIEKALRTWPKLAPEPTTLTTSTNGRTAAEAPAAVETHGLTKRYGPVLALDGLDLTVPAGSIFGLLGPNGAGKSTTLRILIGLTQPSAGSGSVAGIAIGSADGELPRRIGYLDQDPRFYGWMKGRELLELVGRLHGLEGLELKARVREVLEITGLTKAADRRIGGYSGGMRQRLGIGQALLNRPQVLFLDEPVSSLDPEGRREILAIIERLRGTATVVFSTHILSDVERVCDRVAILDQGRLLAEAPIDELLHRHAQPVYEIRPAANGRSTDGAAEALAGALRGRPWVRELRPEPDRLRVFVTDEAAASAEILPLIASTGVAVEGFERVRPNLEEVFVTLVAESREKVSA